jgi:hypothetical protein
MSKLILPRRKLLIGAGALAGSLLLPRSAFANFTIGVSPVFADSGTTSNSITLNSCVAGQTVILGYMTETTTFVSLACTGETVNLRGTQFVDTWQMRMADCLISTGGNKTFTLTVTGSPASQLWGFQLAGGAATYDTSVNQGATAANPSISITTGAANCLLVGQIVAHGGSVTPGSGYTSMGLDDWIFFDEAEYNLNAGSAGANTVTFTTVSGIYSAQAYSWKPPGGGAAATPLRTLMGTGL